MLKWIFQKASGDQQGVWMTRNTGLKTYNSFYLWLFKRHLISDKSETRGWCSCISSELIPGNHSKSQSQIRGFPLSKNSGWPAIKLSLVNRWQSLSEILVTHSLLLEPFSCMRQKLPFFLFYCSSKGTQHGPGEWEIWQHPTRMQSRL